MKKYQVAFMEETGGFVFVFDWDKETTPTEEEVLELFRNANDDDESYNAWKDLMEYDGLSEC